MIFPIAIERGDAKHAFGVIVPDLPGCHSAGDTLQQAFVCAKEAIKGHLELLIDSGEEIPLPRDLDVHFHDPEFAGYIWGVVDINIEPYLGKTKKYNITMPMNIKRQADAVVDGMDDGSLSGFVTEAVLEKLERLNHPKN